MSGDGIRVGPDFNLPDEILSLIPTDPYDQLDLARKITSMAIASRVTTLETDADRLRQQLLEKNRLVEELQNKVLQFEHAHREAESRLKATRDDNMKLLEERDSLTLTVKRLTRDLAKLETFKRQLLQSLNEEDPSKTEIVDIGTYDQSIPKAYPDNDDELDDYAKRRSYSESTDTTSISYDVSKQSDHSYSMAPYISPRLTPIATPNATSSSVSPRRYSAASSPGAASPSTRYEGRVPLSYLYSSQQSSTTSSPPPGRPLPARPRIDGKEFFRQARTRLSLEQFSTFLANIKEFNAQKQSHEETLRKAEEIFGADNNDLYVSFQRLINRGMN